jgi:cytoskeletal protein CcmA (bactofilin family)
MDPDDTPVPPGEIPTLTERGPQTATASPSPPVEDGTPGSGPSPYEAAPLVPMGQAMPDSQRVPTLLPQVQALPVAPDAASAPRVSTLGIGLSFVGSARIQGSLTISGEVQGNIELLDGGSGHVTVTQSGTVVGDIKARNISVLGQTEGLLDAAGGRVSLHDTASVSGRIRYTHLQVNGADLNAQLERVRPEGGDSSRAR